MSDRTYIQNLAKNLVSKMHIDHYREIRKKKNISSETIRIVYTPQIVEWLLDSKITPETLGRICSFGNNYCRQTYKDAFIVTTGTNAWSAMFLSTGDSGLTMLQKIAVATILSEIDHMINHDMPNFSQSWRTIDIGDEIIMDVELERLPSIKKKLGWES